MSNLTIFRKLSIVVAILGFIAYIAKDWGSIFGFSEIGTMISSATLSVVGGIGTFFGGKTISDIISDRKSERESEKSSGATAADDISDPAATVTRSNGTNIDGVIK